MRAKGGSSLEISDDQNIPIHIPHNAQAIIISAAAGPLCPEPVAAIVHPGHKNVAIPATGQRDRPKSGRSVKTPRDQQVVGMIHGNGYTPSTLHACQVGPDPVSVAIHPGHETLIIITANQRCAPKVKGSRKFPGEVDIAAAVGGDPMTFSITRSSGLLCPHPVSACVQFGDKDACAGQGGGSKTGRPIEIARVYTLLLPWEQIWNPSS